MVVPKRCKILNDESRQRIRRPVVHIGPSFYVGLRQMALPVALAVMASCEGPSPASEEAEKIEEALETNVTCNESMVAWSASATDAQKVCAGAWKYQPYGDAHQPDGNCYLFEENPDCGHTQEVCGYSRYLTCTRPEFGVLTATTKSVQNSRVIQSWGVGFTQVGASARWVI